MNHFENFDHEISENTELTRAYADLARLTSVNFKFNPELQQTLIMVDSTLPQLKGFSVAELIRMIPEIVPPEIEFQYEYGPASVINVHLRYQEAGN